MKFHQVLPDLFCSRARAKILEQLLFFPRKEWTGRELSRHARVSPPQTQMALRVLEAYDLVFSRPAGRSRLWVLNREHAFITPLKSLLSVREDFQAAFVDALRSDLDRTSFEKIREITLFGSVARGQDRHGSDIDVFVVVSDPRIVEKIRETCLEISVRLMDRFGKVVMPLVWSPIEVKEKNPSLLRNIRREGITFFEVGTHG